MDDPVQRHPTRAEQLDILATLVADQAGAGAFVLDLGCGKGYVAQLILEKHPSLHLVGVDLSSAALTEAESNLADHRDRLTFIAGNLEAIDEIPIPEHLYQFVITALTFHDLTEAGKRAVIRAAAEKLAPGGYVLIYDRVRLTEAALFPLQRIIWERIERVHGRGMRTADSYDAYLDDLGSDNRPASLDEYLNWFREVGLAPACLHLHGNVALFAGAKAS